MTNLIQRCCRTWLVAALLFSLLSPRPSQAQTPSPSPTVEPPAVLPTATPSNANTAALGAQVDAIMAQMSVADKVGQLFIIGFEGGRVDIDSDVAELIYGYRVGGVVLSTRNNNFVNDRN